MPRWTLGAVPLFIAGIIGCLNPPPRVETPGTPPVSQEAAPPGASSGEARTQGNDIKLLTPQKGAMQRLSGAAPEFPMELRLPGRNYVVSAKICVSNAGVVDSVSILAGSEPALATNVVSAVKGWRYTPLTVNGGVPLAFCYFAKFVFRPV